METFIGILLGFFVGAAAAPYLPKWLKPKPRTPGPAPETQPAKTTSLVELAAPAATETVPLSTRLHRLSSTMETFGDETAHPRELIDHHEFQEAVQLLANPDVPTETVRQYALGANWTLCCAALAALAMRTDRDEPLRDVVANFAKLRPWAMFFALEYFLTVKQRPSVGAASAQAQDWWAENLIIPGLFREYFAKSEKLGDGATFGSALSGVSAAMLNSVDRLLYRVDHSYARILRVQLHRFREQQLDTNYLTEFGRFWTAQPEADIIVEPELWKAKLTDLENALLQSPPRSVLIAGEPRVGKTCLLRLLGARMIAKGWRVFEASAAEIMAGQKYIGEIEGRVRRTVEELAAGKRVAWYIPNLLQAAASGTHRGQAASILDQILPAVTAGRLVVLTEATPAAAGRLLQAMPKLRSTFEIVRLEPHTETETAALAEVYLQKLEEELSISFEADCIPSAVYLARQYLGTGLLPGTVLDLLKISANRVETEGSKRMTGIDLITTLAQVTGLPASILDSRERVDLKSVRDFLGSRVIGQDDAVGAIVDRIAMLKAGLTDPGRPIGVFLFAGPTGTGKTELAKTVAEYLFGSADRLLRLDMSEFQTPESTQKILGDAGGFDAADSLIQRVRKQPFSVVLLDEFEKAHSNIWDLFLQVFDDGRLSDASGQVADFRHCIIILTSNLGATAHRSLGVGFNAKSDSFSSDYVMRAIGQTFRPEFINRLDAVIVFRQLSRDLMRDILQKELKRILDRRGLKDRDWAVEWEASALEFLLEKGFSPEMGARPLKRAIDQFVLAPLAATIVEHRIPEGDQFLFMRSDGQSIQAEFIDPDADEERNLPSPASAGSELSLAAMILQAGGSNGERLALEGAATEIGQVLQSQEWEQLKERLTIEMAASEFWSRPDRHKILARVSLMDRVKAASQTVNSLRDRLAKSKRKSGYSRELVMRLAQQIHIVREGIRDALDDMPVELVLQIEPALDSGTTSEAVKSWCNEICEMYRGWANKRGMQLASIGANNSTASATLLISGFGACRALQSEAGLHVLEKDEDESDRVIVRVRVAPTPAGEVSPSDAMRCLDAIPRSGTVVRRYRSGRSPLVRDAKKGWRSGKFESVLQGNFDLIGSV